MKMELEFWEAAKILEGRLAVAKKNFQIASHKFLGSPTDVKAATLIVAIRGVQQAELQRYTHAGAQRCEP